MSEIKINFGFSFSEPHTITLCRPSASEKIIAEVSRNGIKFLRATGSLKNTYPLSWNVIPQDIQFAMSVCVDKEDSCFTKWCRHKSGAPALLAEGKNKDVNYSVSAIAVKKGFIVKTTAKNTGEKKHECYFHFAHTTGWVISNKGWIDGVNSNVLMTMNDGRADRLLVCAYGAQEYPLFKKDEDTQSTPPMANENFGIKTDSMKKICAYDVLLPNETKTGYFFLPYEMYFEEISSIDPQSFEGEMERAYNEWEKLISKGAKIHIEDEMLMHCYRACLADLFVMRERVGKRMCITAGTKVYRSANSGESLEATMLLETIGYRKEAENDYPFYLAGQDADGCWATSKGWEHELWGVIYNKAAAVMQHYYISRDLDFLKENYERMYASTMFNTRSRESTKNSSVISERGLLKRGMGDCGMMNGSDFYGVFYPHNILALAADFKTLEAAKILGRKEDVKFLTTVCSEAKDALLKSIRENLAEIDGCNIIPAVAGMPVNSMYGCLYSFFPAGLLDADDPIIRDTVHLIENGKKSKGGLPVGMGWLKDGLWVAMALSNVARAYLRMGEDAVQYLYPALNHASHFVTWCEERGAEAGSSVTSGDMQHLWTPLSVCQYITEALFFEDEQAVHICAGIDPEWLSSGKEVSVKGYYSSYGKTDFKVANTGDEYVFSIKTERKIEKKILLHLPNEIRAY